MTTPRYRCNNCGNLTRFDVTSTRTTKAFHHYAVGGDLTIEDAEVLAEKVDAIECHWCNSGSGVEEIAPA